MLRQRVSSYFAMRVSSRCVRQVFSYFALRLLWWSADVLASGSGRSCRPWCKFGVNTARVTLEIGVHCNSTLLQSSWKPLSQYISQVMCWKERLRWIVFDRTAILFSERASNCTKDTVFWWTLQVLYTAFLGFSRIVLDFFQILIGVHRVHGSEKHGLPVSLETLPTRMNPHWMMECMSWAFPTW